LRKIFANKKLNINIVFKDIPKGLRGINAKLSVEKEEKDFTGVLLRRYW